MDSSSEKVLKPGSRAIEICEPCQGRNTAALSKTFYVPWERLSGAFKAGDA